MKQLKCYTILGIIFVLVTGSHAHFLYDWTGNNEIVGLFTPINESIWEHMKLLFFPMLIYSIIMIAKCKQNHPCITSALCFGILTGTFLIPVFFYTYTYILGKDIFILDIGIFLLSVLIAFWLSYKLTLSCRLKPCARIVCLCTGILFTCFLLFSYYPPHLGLFKDWS